MTVKVKCLLCDKVFTCDPMNTMNLVKHIQIDHPEVKLLTDDLVMQTSSVFGQVIEKSNDIIHKPDETFKKSSESFAHLSKITEESNEIDYLDKTPARINEDSDSIGRKASQRNISKVIRRSTHTSQLPKSDTVASKNMSTGFGLDKYIKTSKKSNNRYTDEILLKNNSIGSDESEQKKTIFGIKEPELSRSIQKSIYGVRTEPAFNKTSPSYLKYMEDNVTMLKEPYYESEKLLRQSKYNMTNSRPFLKPLPRQPLSSHQPLTSDENVSMRDDRSVAGSDIQFPIRKKDRRRSSSKMSKISSDVSPARSRSGGHIVQHHHGSHHGSHRSHHSHHSHHRPKKPHKSHSHHSHRSHRSHRSHHSHHSENVIPHVEPLGHSVHSHVIPNEYQHCIDNRPCRQRSPCIKPKLIKASVKKWRTGRCEILCPQCGLRIRPLIQQSVEKYTSNAFGAACVMSCCWPCGLMPFLFPPPPKEYLFCSHCNYFFGIYDDKTGTIKTDGAPMRYCDRQ